MRPVRTVAAVVFVAAIAITGCAAHSAVQPSPAPSPPVVEQAPLPDDPRRRILRGRAFAALSRPERAAPEFVRAVQLAPN